MRSMHMWDNVLRHGLCSLTWFGSFLAVIKALTKFVIDERRGLIQAFADASLHGVVAILRSVSVPPFAKWRWGTLYSNTHSLRHILPLLRNSFHIVEAYFKRMKDGVLVQKVRVACTDAVWEREFQFVLWFSSVIVKTQEWGSTCKCHEQDYLDHIPVTCSRKGLLLPWAWDKCQSALQDILNAVNSWEPNTWGGSRTFFDGLCGMVRGVYSRGQQKSICFDDIPLLFARAGGEAGVNLRCVVQFDSAPVAKHDKASVEIVTQFRNDLLEMGNTLVMSARLSHRLEGVKCGNLDDKIAEGPHATFKHEHDRARGSHFAWAASSVRLQQNLSDIRELADIVDVPIQELWDRYKTVLQTARGARSQCNPKLSIGEFTDRVYYCNFVFGDEFDNQYADSAFEY